MKTLIRLSVVCTFCFGAPSFACLNDSELPSHESEFRSQYLNKPVIDSMLNSTPDSRQAVLFTIAGITFLAFGFGSVWFHRPRHAMSEI